MDDIISEEKEHLKDLSKKLRNEVARKNLTIFQKPKRRIKCMIKMRFAKK